MNVDASVTTALATLLGAATGGLTSVLATLLTQRTQARAQWFEQEALRRRDLYKEFIALCGNSARPVVKNSRHCGLCDVTEGALS